MNEPEVVTSLLEQIDKLTEEANRYRTALQDILEETNEDLINHPELDSIHCIAHRALEEPIVKVELDGQLYVFGESTIEYRPGGDNPFKRIKEGE